MAEGTRMQRYRFVGIVLESPRHGPQLCTFVQQSNPPQCSGPDVIGWDWNSVDATSLQGTTWGDYDLVGTFDGERFSLTEPARPATRGQPKPSGPDFGIPCPPPTGGWHPVDPARTTQQALDAAFERVMQARDHAGVWVRDLRNNWVAEGHDPSDLVLIAKFAGGLSGRKAWIREVWGGALCISPARHSLAELESTQHQLLESLGRTFRMSTINVPANRVEVECYVVTDDLQRRVNELHGPDTVELTSWLKPIDE